MQVSLRQIEVADLGQLRQWLSDPSLAEYFRRDGAGLAWRSDSVLLAHFSTSYLVIADGAVAGLVCATLTDGKARKAEVGVAILEGVAQKRSEVAIPALFQVGAWLFEQENLNKIFCLILSHRDDLRHLLTRFNFSEEGLLRDNVYFGGKFHDEYSFGLTRADYDDLRKTY